MKSLLFLGTGSVLHATGERNLGRLGGLIHRMPWVAWLTLIGAMAIAALPPLNGFVSEWLLLQSFLFTPQVPHPFLNMLLPMCAALFVLAAALAGYVMVKFFGIVFLGQAREPTLADAHDAGTLERAGMLWLALGCVALGLLPGVVVPLLGRIATELSLGGIPTAGSSLWLLAPLTGRQASYSALLFLLAIGTVVALTALAVRAAYHRRVRFGPPWDCGFGGLDARMQDTAEGFGQPIRFLFQPLFRIERELPAPDDARPHYRIEVQDRTWALLYRPLQRLVQAVADRAAMLQQGRIAVYLTYSLLTLILMLALVL
jgi:NADH:ubiquinone oxidoreductase subunit 5 (subunit L)/multisubunit Na+/H+ antiporter MnhA subunit